MLPSREGKYDGILKIDEYFQMKSILWVPQQEGPRANQEPSRLSGYSSMLNTLLIPHGGPVQGKKATTSSHSQMSLEWGRHVHTAGVTLGIKSVFPTRTQQEPWLLFIYIQNGDNLTCILLWRKQQKAYFYMLYYWECWMLRANSTEARTAHIHALTATHHMFFLCLREEELWWLYATFVHNVTAH